MAVNDYKPHLFVIPEDDANRQFAHGFELYFRLRSRAMQVMHVAGGWEKVVNQILEIYVPKVLSNPNTHVVGIIRIDTSHAAMFRGRVVQLVNFFATLT